MAPAALPAVEQQFLTFRVAGGHYSLPASNVSEVIRLPPVTRVPLGPPGLSGVANLRGAVLPIVSLRALLGGDTNAPPSTARVIVVDRGSLIGLVVDEVTALTQATSAFGSGSAQAPRGIKKSRPAQPRLLDLDALLAPTFESSGRRVRSPRPADDPRRAEAATSVRDELTFVCFAIGGQEFAFPLNRVSEVVALPPEVTIIPRTEDGMLGVASIRGRLLPLLSLAALLGLGTHRNLHARARIVVATVGGAAIGLVVDHMKEILRVPKDRIDPVPAVLTRGAGEAEIQGICRLDHGRRLVSILSTDRLLRNADGQGYESAESQMGDDTLSTNANGSAIEQFVILQLGGEEYGLPIGVVDEIVRVPETLTRLPSAPDFVEGLMNLRGRVVPIIDQRRRFETEQTGSRRRERVVVVTIDQMQAGFVVDAVTEVLRVPIEQLRPAPELAADRSRVIDRIANIEVEGRMILLLDARELLDRAEKDLLKKTRVAAQGRHTS
jgi:purine-binding chemotaxis protein CheW